MKLSLSNKEPLRVCDAIYALRCGGVLYDSNDYGIHGGSRAVSQSKHCLGRRSFGLERNQVVSSAIMSSTTNFAGSMMKKISGR